MTEFVQWLTGTHLAQWSCVEFFRLMKPAKSQVRSGLDCIFLSDFERARSGRTS